MATDKTGKTNAEFASWMVGTAHQDCNDLTELSILHTDGSVETLTDCDEICEFMSEVTADSVATFQEVTYTGFNPEAWDAIDQRLTTNLERTQNNGAVPIKIKRPIGY